MNDDVVSLLLAVISLLLSTCSLSTVCRSVRAPDRAPCETETCYTLAFDSTANYRTAPKRVPAPDFVPPVVQDIPIKRACDVPPFQVAVAVLLAFAFGTIVATVGRLV